MKHLKTQQTPDIDWSKPMWVYSKRGLIGRSCGIHDKDTFNVLILPCNEFPNGINCAGIKSMWAPITGTIMFPISNED